MTQDESSAIITLKLVSKLVSNLSHRSACVAYTAWSLTAPECRLIVLRVSRTLPGRSPHQSADSSLCVCRVHCLAAHRSRVQTHRSACVRTLPGRSPHQSADSSPCVCRVHCLVAHRARVQTHRSACVAYTAWSLAAPECRLIVLCVSRTLPVR